MLCCAVFSSTLVAGFAVISGSCALAIGGVVCGTSVVSLHSDLCGFAPLVRIRTGARSRATIPTRRLLLYGPTCQCKTANQNQNQRNSKPNKTKSPKRILDSWILEFNKKN